MSRPLSSAQGVTAIFRELGQRVARHAPWFLAVWIILLAVAWAFAPPWAEVAKHREFAFLPEDMPSRRGEEMLAKAFPRHPPGSNIVLILEKDDSEVDDLGFINDVLEPRLRKIAIEEGGMPANPWDFKSKPLVSEILTPNSGEKGQILISPDKKASLVVVQLTTEFLSSEHWPLIDDVRSLMSELRDGGSIPEGLSIHVTGSAVLGRERTTAQVESARSTELITIGLVVFLLVAIYRAPLLALIPLMTVALTVQLALKILAILAQHGWLTVFQGVEIYLTILTYGAGVDYCLFLIARFREEIANKTPSDQALINALANVGPALAASAGTVICGVAMMAFANFGKFRQAGLTLPISLTLVLLATLTFSTALLRLAGRWAFWPHHPDTDHQGLDRLHRGWAWLGRKLSARPGTIWTSCVAGMLPFAIMAVIFAFHFTYDFIGSLPPSTRGVTGMTVLDRHFPPGAIGPVTMILVDPNADFHRDDGRKKVEKLTQVLDDNRDRLGLADVRSLTSPLGVGKAVPNVPEAREQAEEYYTSSLGERNHVATRFDLTLAGSPFARSSVEHLNALDTLMQSETSSESSVYFAGTTAGMRDLRQVTGTDQTRIELLVLSGILLILVVLLRRFWVSVYLLASVYFSYLVTLGFTYLLFWAMDPQGFQGLDWKVSLFLFTILISVGEDYNIFLMTRVHEAQAERGPVPGIIEALSRTGPIISSCGIIMAGTFASLLPSRLPELQQLGTALATGILLDTFVVRPILVPAFLVIVARRHKRAAWRAGLDRRVREQPIPNKP